MREKIIEAMAAGMYGSGWSGPVERQPGERMKDVWRKYCIDAFTAIEALGYNIVPKIAPIESRQAGTKLALSTSLGGDYHWQDYMADLYVTMNEAGKV
jgi:hypothetical protein